MTECTMGLSTAQLKQGLNSQAGQLRSTKIAEIVRMPLQPTISTVAMSVIPLNESFSVCVLVFFGPSDTEIKFNGDTLEVSREHVDEFEVYMVNNNANMDRRITLKSKSKGETITMYPNFNYNLPIKSSFIENTCYVKIEKDAMGERTKYTATVTSFAEREDLENLSKYFIACIRDRSGARVQLSTRHLNETENENVVSYYKYLDTYYSGSKTDSCSEYYSILNYSAIEADGITVESFGFVLNVSSSDYYGNDMAINRSWYYQIV
ncbi:uncharacterized protein LOC128171249 isoform X1 [Crassostrea angulata]|uniref:uncharacterized protein LOC128171249 isoform X1 n=1 Tax=Magallana angulata TaxID=2784310 RepID=UPI0022B0F3E5|nr:uncharacterized protein LOC128171249 isoform X1 [Crassostrea angulata]